MANTRLLLLNTDLEPGGTPRVVRDLAIRLRNDSTNTLVASLKPAGAVGAEIEQAGVEVRSLHARRSADLPAAVRRLQTLVAGERIGVVLSFLVHANLVAHLAGGGCSGTVFFQSIQTTQHRPRWHWLMQRMAARSARRVIVPSESVADVARRRCGVAADRIELIPNAIDADRFTARQRVTDADRPVIGFVGRLDPIKRVADLLLALSLLPDRITLQVFGDGPERSALQQQARGLGLCRRVRFHGVIEDVGRAYDTIDLVVLPSDAEGMPLVLLEAMSAGVPIVATRVPGIRDVVEHESTALLVGPRSPQTLARAILSALDDRDSTRQRVGRAAEHVRSTYNWPGILARYRRVLGLE